MGTQNKTNIKKNRITIDPEELTRIFSKAVDEFCSCMKEQVESFTKELTTEINESQAGPLSKDNWSLLLEKGGDSIQKLLNDYFVENHSYDWPDILRLTVTEKRLNALKDFKDRQDDWDEDYCENTPITDFLEKQGESYLEALGMYADQKELNEIERYLKSEGIDIETYLTEPDEEAEENEADININDEENIEI